MEAKEKMVKLIKKQIEIEKTNVEQVSETEDKIGNAAAKLLLHIIGTDSQKHADILNGILEVLSGIPPSKTLWEHKVESYVDPFVVKKELENHIEREAEMIKHVEKELKHTEDEGLKQLLRHILDDEKKHHKILKTIVKNLHKMNA